MTRDSTAAPKSAARPFRYLRTLRRHLLEDVIPGHTTMEAFEVEHEFPDIGHRVMSLDAREVLHPEAQNPELLLVIEDITERRAIEREKQDLLRQKELLLQETQHRINNSLQIIPWGWEPGSEPQYVNSAAYLRKSVSVREKRPISKSIEYSLAR